MAFKLAYILEDQNTINIKIIIAVFQGQDIQEVLLQNIVFE